MPWSPEDLPPSVSKKDWSESQKKEFCRIANAMLAKGIDEGEVIATATKRVESNENSDFYESDHPRDDDGKFSSNGGNFKPPITPQDYNTSRSAAAQYHRDTAKFYREKGNKEASESHEKMAQKYDRKESPTSIKRTQKAWGEYATVAALSRKLKENRNASDFPQFYYAKHMKPGLAKYEEETILVDNDAIKNMIPSMNGRPVYIHHNDVDLETMKSEASGYVTDSFYNELDGCAWCKIMIIDDEAHDVIKKNWSVSNAYSPTQHEGAGTMHNCPYDRKITNGEFTHLALVPNPRYEDAVIMTPDEFKAYQEVQKKQIDELRNSKTENTQESKPMFKFFKPAATEITNAADITDDTYIEFQGKKITVGELNQILNSKKNKKNEDEDEKSGKHAEKEDCHENKKEKKNKMKNKKNADPKKHEDDEDEDDKENEVFDMDGEDVTMNELKKAWAAHKKNRKKNESDDEDYDNESEDEDDDGEDEEDDDGREGGKKRKRDEEEPHENKKNKKEKKNSRDIDYFNEVRNAHLKQAFQSEDRVIETAQDKAARGRQLFGLDKK